MPLAAAAAGSGAGLAGRAAATAARTSVMYAPARAAAAPAPATTAGRCKRSPPAAAAAWPAPVAAASACTIRRSSMGTSQPALVCCAIPQQPEPDLGGAEGADMGSPGSSSSSSTGSGSSPGWGAQPQDPQALLSSLEASIEAARNEFFRSVRELPQTARAAVGLLPQLHYPTPRFIARFTAQILLVVAAFLVYVVLVDRLCSTVPRFLLWTRQHPGWAQQATAAAGPAAAAQLVALQQGVGQLAAAVAAFPGLLQAAADSTWALASSPEALRQAAAGCLAALWQAPASAAAVGQALLTGLAALAKRRLAGA